MEGTKPSEKDIVEDNNNKKESRLPESGKRNILITSALPYVNNVPHLGNIVGSTLSADVFSRYCKQRGENAIYICGTDEYGTATETRAIQEGLTPQQICDKYHKIHSEVYQWFDIEFDHFGRTTTQQQTDIAQDIFLKLHKNGYLLEDSLQQLYCEKCQKFLADRFVEGKCPKCGFEEARGDQCDGCGQLLNATELIEPTCKLDKTRPVIKSTVHLFLDLPKLSDKLEEWVNEASVKGQWTQNAIQITKAWLKEGLKPRCITRDLKWGTPVPLEQYKDKVFYVWFDAPIGYISITANYTPQWQQWWRNPKEVQLYQFMGKDNVPFHTVIFPASLIGSGDTWTLLHHVSTTEYLNYEGGKFSKSRGTGVFGSDAVGTGIPSEIWRYYLLSNRPESSDSSFSWDDLMDKTNNELIANLGNFVNRAISFASTEFQGIVPEFSLNEDDKKFIESINEQLAAYIDALDNVHLKDGLKIAMAISKLGNKYVQDNKPWELIKTDKARCGTVVYVSINLVSLLSSILRPYMPGFSKKVLAQINSTEIRINSKFEFTLKPGHKLGTPSILFKKLQQKDIEGFKQKFGGKQTKENNNEDAFPLDIRGAVVESVEDHPSDEALYVAKVDVGGGEKRQVVARLKSVYKRDELLNRKVVVLCNLPVAEIKGAKSEAMMLVAEGKKNKESVTCLLQPNGDVKNWVGTRFEAEGIKTVVKQNITLKEFQKLDLKLKDAKAVFKQKFVLKNADGVGLTAVGIEGAAKIK